MVVSDGEVGDGLPRRGSHPKHLMLGHDARSICWCNRLRRIDAWICSSSARLVAMASACRLARVKAATCRAGHTRTFETTSECGAGTWQSVAMGAPQRGHAIAYGFIRHAQLEHLQCGIASATSSLHRRTHWHDHTLELWDHADAIPDAHTRHFRLGGECEPELSALGWSRID